MVNRLNWLVNQCKNKDINAFRIPLMNLLFKAPVKLLILAAAIYMVPNTFSSEKAWANDDQVAIIYVYPKDVDESKVYTKAELEQHFNGPILNFWKEQSYGRYNPTTKVFVWELPLTAQEIEEGKEHYIVDTLMKLLPNGGNFVIPGYNPSQFDMTQILMGGNVIGYGGGMGKADLKVNGTEHKALSVGSFTYGHPTSPYWIPNLRFGYYNEGAPFRGHYNGETTGYPELGLNGNDGTLLHEWGHGLGLSTHANSWRSEEEPLYGELYWSKKKDYWAQEFDYGNLFDIMGGSPYYSLHIHSFYKELVGWLLPSEKIVVTETQRNIKLAPLESSGIGEARAAQIPVSGSFSRPSPFNSSQDYSFYIEYRRPIGLDRHLSHEYLSSNTEGLMVYMTRRQGNGFINSWLLDMSPDNIVYDKAPSFINTEHDNESDVHEVALLPGNTFYDKQTGWTLTNVRPDDNQGILFDAEKGEKVGVASGVYKVALFSGDSLTKGDIIYSPDLTYTFMFQNDSNLVVRRASDERFIWGSPNGGIPLDVSVDKLTFNDGNLAVYAGDKMLWSSNTGNNPGARFVISNEGHPMVLSSTGEVLWPR